MRRRRSIREEKGTPDPVKFDEDLFAFYKAAIGIRRKHEALNHGDFSVVATDDSQQVLVTMRESKSERLYLVTNRGDAEARIDLKISGKITPMFASSGDLDAVKIEKFGMGVSAPVPGLTGVVLRGE